MNTNGTNGNGKVKTKDAEVIEWYLKGEKIADIVDACDLSAEKDIYTILHRNNIPLRRNHKVVSVDLPAAKTPPKREWFLIDECAAILGMKTEDIEWFIHRGIVHSDMGETTTGGKFTLVYLPSLVDAQQHTGIDGKRAKQLLTEAWTMLDKVARQRTVNINDASFICGAIHDFFEANGWTLK